MVLFDINLASVLVSKYKKERKTRKNAKLIQQLIDLQKYLGDQQSILGTYVLVYGYYTYDELKSIIEDDLGYCLQIPKDDESYLNSRRHFFKAGVDKFCYIKFTSK